MSDTTNIGEGEQVIINTNRYKRVGEQLINMDVPSDIIEIGDQSLIGMMIENLGIVNG